MRTPTLSSFTPSSLTLARLLLNRTLADGEFTAYGNAQNWEVVEQIIASNEFHFAIADPLVEGRRPTLKGAAWKIGQELAGCDPTSVGLSSDEARAVLGAGSWARAMLAFLSAQGAASIAGRPENAGWLDALKSICDEPERSHCTVEDLENFYRCLLGRAPELPPHPSRCADISEVAVGFLRSDEFQNAVYRPLVENQCVPGLRFIDDPAEELCAWSATAFPLTVTTHKKVRSASSWRELFEAIFSDPRLQDWLSYSAVGFEADQIAKAVKARTKEFSSHRPNGQGIVHYSEVNSSNIADRVASIKSDLQDRFRPRRRRVEAASSDGLLISLIVPIYNTPLDPLVRMVESVRGQTHSHWELCLADDGSSDFAIHALLATLASVDKRIKLARLPDNSGISNASNAALQLATGAYVGLLDHDDTLTYDALAIMARAIQEFAPDILYSDECLISQEGVPEELFPKPDWSPILMLNMMYVNHFTMYRTGLVREIGGFRKEFDFSQDYDLLLRASEEAKSIHHVEAFLYGWRKIPGSAASGGKSHARRTNIAALQSAIDRRGWGGVVQKLPTANHVFRRSRLHPKVAIVVPSDNLAHIRSTIDSIAALTSYDNFEIRIVTRSSVASDLNEYSDYPGIEVKLIKYDRPYNFSDKCNVGAAGVKADFLIFFNDDVRVISPDWIESLLELLTLPGVGAVGPKLVYEDRTIQHAGMVTGTRRLVGTAFHSLPSETDAHFNFAQCVRDVSLLCGACLAMPSDLFNHLGGFDALNTPIAHSDVDLCLRVREAALSCVYTPHAELLHFGHVSIGREEQKSKQTEAKDKADIYIMQRFGDALARDPFFPRSMVETLYHDSQEPFAYYPSVRRNEILRSDILLVSHDLTLSGAPKIVFDMARVLLERRRFVVVVSPSDGPMRPRLVDLGVHVIIEPLIFRGSSAVRDFVKNFDQVVVNTIVGWPLLEQMSTAVPMWMYAHESDLVDHLAHDVRFVPALSSALGLWAGSTRSSEALSRHGLTSRIIPYGVDDLQVQAASSRPEMSVVVLGSFEPRKAQDLAVLGALEALNHGAELTLDLYGRCLDPTFYEGVVERTGGSTKVRLHGEVSYETYKELVKGADVVLVPSRDDTLPLVSLDALSAGKALVCAETVGTSAFLRDSENALIVAGPTVGTIAKALKALAADPSLRTRLGRGARQVFETHFTHGAFERSLLEALDIDRVGTREMSATTGRNL